MLDEYCSLGGNLLFNVVKVGPDCANAVRNFTCHMSNPGICNDSWLAMKTIFFNRVGSKNNQLIF